MNHNHHSSADLQPPGHCPACDEYHDKAMNVPVCYTRHEPAPGVHQDVPHLNTQCMEEVNRHNILCIGCEDCKDHGAPE